MEKDVWINVENSSLITGYKYISEESKFKVEFKSNGAMYAYLDVPEYVADSINPESPGKDIKVRIMGGGYKYKKVN